MGLLKPMNRKTCARRGAVSVGRVGGWVRGGWEESAGPVRTRGGGGGGKAAKGWRRGSRKRQFQRRREGELADERAPFGSFI
jgi:hypothetical protein